MGFTQYHDFQSEKILILSSSRINSLGLNFVIRNINSTKYTIIVSIPEVNIQACGVHKIGNLSLASCIVHICLGKRQISSIISVESSTLFIHTVEEEQSLTKADKI